MANNILQAHNVRVSESGERYIVLGHGMGTDQSVWNRLPFFTGMNPDSFDIIKYATLDGYVDDLLNILDALGVDGCAYVGHSTSAMIGILASIRRPQLFSKLILLCASPRFLNDDNNYRGGFDRVEVQKMFAAMEANYEAWVYGFAPEAVGADLPEVIREFSRTLFTMRPDISLFVCRTIVNTDIRSVLGQVRVPCCIIHTARDAPVPLSAAEYLRNHLGGRTTLQILNTEDHLPHLSAPALTGPAICRALPR
ncbi:hypothetical protein Patl1_28989 [Pistacia atlantica]|uniref:Uncharacterized protein n=1 Tax=Pistacia atlantica TaxID=434234 RepID=A0ACC1BH84_9ROSI|nr:hypothetical protein Patl1_28989 [Pistacia atlantica]